MVRGQYLVPVTTHPLLPQTVHRVCKYPAGVCTAPMNIVEYYAHHSHPTALVQSNQSNMNVASVFEIVRMVVNTKVVKLQWSR